MAIACFRFVTVFPDRPLLSLPRFISCMARSTLRLPLLLFADMVVLTLPGFGSQFLGVGRHLAYSAGGT